MSTKAQRGTKRTCQNPECGSRFYDLNRDPIVCPICESVYVPSMSANSMSLGRRGKGRPQAGQEAGLRAGRGQSSGRAGGEGEDLVVIEGEEEEATAGAEDDETFLEEEEEDGADVSGIIGGPVDDKDEAT